MTPKKRATVPPAIQPLEPPEATFRRPSSTSPWRRAKQPISHTNLSLSSAQSRKSGWHRVLRHARFHRCSRNGPPSGHCQKKALKVSNDFKGLYVQCTESVTKQTADGSASSRWPGRQSWHGQPRLSGRRAPGRSCRR